VLLARVMGSVVATRKEPELEGLKLLLLQPADAKGVARGGALVVAVDAVGAGAGDLVLCCSGSSARQTEVTQNRPVDATVMAIIDQVEEAGALAYQRGVD
jgi:ethanolamine utilization protein EutN